MITKKSTNQENTKIYQSPIIPQNPQIIQRDHTKPRPKFLKPMKNDQIKNNYMIKT